MPGAGQGERVLKPALLLRNRPSITPRALRCRLPPQPDKKGSKEERVLAVGNALEMSCPISLFLAQS